MTGDGADGWRPDEALGEPFQSRELPLRDGSVATLVRLRADRPGRGALLFVHGWADYFFHAELATRWTEQGYDVYALDLRHYGRSIQPGKLPNFSTDMHEYFEELDAAVAVIRGEEGAARLAVVAHSTGGLITSLWAHARRADGGIDALVLNSPWLDLAEGWLLRVAARPAIDLVGRIRPLSVLPRGLAPVYGQSIHRDHHGEWDYRLDWKPLLAFPIRAGWLAAVRRAHGELHRGLAVAAPVLVMHSARSLLHQTTWSEPAMRADTVLDVEQIHRHAPRIGPAVDTEVIDDGLHDLFLSALPARTKAFDTANDWLAAHLPD